MYFIKESEGFWDSGPQRSAEARELADAVGIKLRHFVMADGDEAATGKPPVAALMYQPPGFYMPRHSHASHRLEFIVEGSLEIDGQVLGPGDVMWARAGESYGPHVAGPDGALTVEIFSSTDGVGAQTEDPSVDAKEMIVKLQAGGLTPEQRKAEISAFAARMRAHKAARTA